MYSLIWASGPSKLGLFSPRSPQCTSTLSRIGTPILFTTVGRLIGSSVNDATLAGCLSKYWNLYPPADMAMFIVAFLENATIGTITIS